MKNYLNRAHTQNISSFNEYNVKMTYLGMFRFFSHATMILYEWLRIKVIILISPPARAYGRFYRCE